MGLRPKSPQLGAGQKINVISKLQAVPCTGFIIFNTCLTAASYARVPPSSAERAEYYRLLAVKSQGDAVKINIVATTGAKIDESNTYGRTPLHVAAFSAHHAAMRAPLAGGADSNALENDDYDIVTIAAVANYVHTLKLALALA